MKKKNCFIEMVKLSNDNDFTRSNFKMFVSAISAISILSSLSSCGGGEGNNKSGKENTQKKGNTQYMKLKKEKGKIIDVLRSKFGQNGTVEFVNKLNPKQFEELANMTPKEVEDILKKFPTEELFTAKLNDANKDSNEQNTGDNSLVGNQDVKDKTEKKDEKEELLDDVIKILNKLSDGNKDAKEKLINYFKLLKEIEAQDDAKTFKEEYEKSTEIDEDKKIISCLSKALSGEPKQDILKKLSDKLQAEIEKKLDEGTKGKVNIKVTIAKKDKNIEFNISYIEKTDNKNYKNIVDDNGKKFYIIDSVEFKNENKSIKIIVVNSDDSETLEKYESPNLDKLTDDKKEKLGKLITEEVDKFAKENTAVGICTTEGKVAQSTGANLETIFENSKKFYKALIEGKNNNFGMTDKNELIIDGFGIENWYALFGGESDFKKFIIEKLVEAIKTYYYLLNEGTEEIYLKACSKILFDDVNLNYRKGEAGNFIGIKDLHSYCNNYKKYDFEPKNYGLGNDLKYINSEENKLNEEFENLSKDGKCSFYHLLNFELLKRFWKIFDNISDNNEMKTTNGGILILTDGKSDTINNVSDKKGFCSKIFGEFRKNGMNDLDLIANGKYGNMDKTFREGMDDALDDAFKSLKVVGNTGEIQNLGKLLFEYLKNKTEQLLKVKDAQQIDKLFENLISVDSFENWMNEKNIYLEINNLSPKYIDKFCTEFFNIFFGGEKEVEEFMSQIHTLSKENGYKNDEKDKVNKAIDKLLSTQDKYLKSLESGKYTKYWHALLDNTILERMK